MSDPVELRRLDVSELARVAEIDRSEAITEMYEQRGAELLARRGEWSSPPWDPDGHGEHSVESQLAGLRRHVNAGGVAIGAFAAGRIVGIGVVVPHLRPGIAQLAYLHVTAPRRGQGVGRRLSDEMDEIARTAGDTEMVVSATPTGNTVRFYRSRGFEPMGEPLAELFELEPEDVHMHKVL